MFCLNLGGNYVFLLLGNLILNLSIVYFAWSLLHHGLLIGIHRVYLGVPNPTCAFYNSLEDSIHVFWSCLKAKAAWDWILSFFNQFLGKPCSWVHALLGDPLHFSEPLQEMWHIFHTTILFHLWKSKNNIIFDREKASVSFSLSDKYAIFYDSWLQIIIQVEKVNMEVQHLQNMLNF